MTKNIVSILCPSYNHERFVGYFINSLLQQTNPNWELIIVDDCSTDNNVAEIKKIRDTRIKLIQNTYNMGVNCGLNKAFSESNGKYICFCASDDMLLPDFIENVFHCFDKNPDKGIIYCDLQVINNNNELIKNKILPTSHKDKYQILWDSFMYGNCVNSPGMIVKRELFNTLLPLDIPMSQYQDYKMHIDLLLRSDFMIMNKISVLYRKNDSQSGLSAINPITARRCCLEENLLMDSFLGISDIDILKKIFPNELKPLGKITKDVIPFVLGMLALESPREYKKIWGYNQISRFINTQDNYALVNRLYGFSYKDFLKLATKFDNSRKEVMKHKKYRLLFNILLCVCILLAVIIIALLAQ